MVHDIGNAGLTFRQFKELNMKPLFPTLNVPSIKPQVLGLVVDADHEISTNDGVIYVQLHPTDDEVYAEIHFNFEMDYKFIPAEYMDGYLMCGGDVQLGKHNITSWEVVAVEDCEWSPSVDDKVMIKLLINKWIDDNCGTIAQDIYDKACEVEY